MPFTNSDFPGQIFRTIEEFYEAKRKRSEIESKLNDMEGEVTKVIATIIPSPKNVIEERISNLEKRISHLAENVGHLSRLEKKLPKNKEGLEVGTVLRGESRGKEYTLEALEESYLCSDGKIYQSLSGAALGVSDNRRSGWRFWKDVAGSPIGEVTGRFKSNDDDVASNLPAQ